MVIIMGPTNQYQEQQMSQQEIAQPSSNEKVELNLNDIEKALQDDDTPEDTNLLDDKQDKQPKNEKEVKEKTEEDEKLELEDEDEEPKEEDLALQTPPRRKEILAKYPNIFKEFPYLQ